jgi:hypothetical protein
MNRWRELLRALLPLAMFRVSKPILDAVVSRISHGSGNLNAVANPEIGVIFQEYMRYDRLYARILGSGPVRRVVRIASNRL